MCTSEKRAEKSYAEYIRNEIRVAEKMKIYTILNRVAAEGAKEGLFRSSKNEISMRSIYKRLFPSTHNEASLVAAHRMCIYVQDEMEKEALEQINKISSLNDTSIYGVVNYAFLLAITKKMTLLVERFFLRGFPQSINSRVLGYHKNKLFPTYFLFCLSVGNLVMIMLFLKRTVDYQETWHGLSPAHIAATNPDIRVLDLMLDGSEVQDYTTTVQYSALLSLAGHRDGCCMLDGRPIYPIDLAAAMGNWGAVLLLMRRTPKSIRYSQHLLHILDGIEIAAKAIELGAQPEQTLADGSNVMHTKAREGRVNMLSFYIGYGMAVEEKNLRGDTPMSLAIKGGQKECVWLLMSMGAGVSSSFQASSIVADIENGWTPSVAVQKQAEQCINAGEQTRKLCTKKKSRFSITSLFTLTKKASSSDVQKLNIKIGRAGMSASLATKDITQEEAAQKFANMLKNKNY